MMMNDDDKLDERLDGQNPFFQQSSIGGDHATSCHVMSFQVMLFHVTHSLAVSFHVM